MYKEVQYAGPQYNADAHTFRIEYFSGPRFVNLGEETDLIVKLNVLRNMDARKEMIANGKKGFKKSKQKA